MGNYPSKGLQVPVLHPSKESRRRSYQHDPASNKMTSQQLRQVALLVDLTGVAVEDEPQLDESGGVPVGDSFQNITAGGSWKRWDPAALQVNGEVKAFDELVFRALESAEDGADTLLDKTFVVNQREGDGPSS